MNEIGRHTIHITTILFQFLVVAPMKPFRIRVVGHGRAEG